MVDLQVWWGGGRPRPAWREWRVPKAAASRSITGTGLQALSCFCAWGEAAGDPAGQGVGLGLASPLPGHWASQPPDAAASRGGGTSPWSPGRHAWASQRALGKDVGRQGPNLFSRHVVGLGHELPPAAEDSREGPDFWGRHCGEGSGTHSSTLVRKIPWTEEPGGLQSMGLLRVGHD